MNDEAKTRSQLILELAEMRRYIANLEVPPPHLSASGQPSGAETAQKARNELETRDEKRTAELMKANKQLAALFKVGQTITAPLQLDVVLDVIARSTAELLGTDTGVILLLDEPSQTLSIRGAYGLSETVVQGTLDRVGESIAGRVVQTGVPIVANDLPNDPRFYNPSAKNEGLLACASVPLIVGRKIIGTLDAHSKVDRNAFDDGRIQMQRMLASQAAIAIEHARLYDELQAAHDKLETRVQERTAEVLAANEQLRQEIAERKRAEEALAEERNRLRTLIDNMPDSIYVKDTEGRFILGNVATALAANGSAPEQLVGKSDFDFYPEELADQYYQDEQTVIRTGQPLINQEEPFVNPAGLRTWNLTTKVPLRDINGTIVGLVGVSRDISKRKKVEEELNKYRDHLEELVTERTVDLTRVNERLLQEIKVRTQVENALRESKQELQMILTSITDYVWSADIVDGQVHYRYYSPVVEQITGYPPEYYMSGVEAWLKTIYPDDRPQAELQVARELSGDVVSHEYRITRPEGEVIWLQGTTSPTLDRTGTVVRLQGVVSDITERKQLEAQLRQAQKMEAIGTLAGGIAHDFNNMLTAVIGYADLALDLLTPDHPVYEDIRGIRKISDRAADLTRQLLAFARRQMIEPDVLNLNDLILNLGEMLGRLIGEDIALEIQPAPDLGQIRVDPNQIEQVLVNLVVNARDAILNGGQITITTANVLLNDNDIQERAEIVPGQYVRLAVHDNGTGMTEEVKSHIFEPFFTTKEVGEGTGLGLATSFGIIKQSQGHIEVESEAGLGTTVEVYLPQVEEVGSGLPQAKSSQDLPLGRATVLLVEDDISVRHLTVRMLRHHGYTVIEAAHGEEALELYKQQPDNKIDLVITDVVMPQMGGKPLADQIRAIRPESKILFVSGYTDKILAHKDILEPGVGFLHKPYSPEMLIRKVYDLLTGNKGQVTNKPSRSSTHPRDGDGA